MICLCMVSCSIRHLCHLLRFVYWVYLSLWVLVRFFYMSFHSLSHSCHHLLITPFVLFCYHHISILSLAFIIICFILSLLFPGLMILHILVQRGQSYHSIHPIIWHWLRYFSLRGCLMGWGSCTHQWFERVCSFLVSFPLEFDLLMIMCIFFYKKSAMTCLCMVSCSIGHLYHLLRFIY